ncbi:hypothetical protein [Tissierella sp.]|uniref:hypothetical protein n=1 Tax=Tissierella sp. TaxID=41274 RepID=UPI00302DF4D5
MKKQDYKNKLNEMAKKLGVEIVKVNTIEDIHKKCDGFTMITNFSKGFNIKEEKKVAHY